MCVCVCVCVCVCLCGCVFVNECLCSLQTIREPWCQRGPALCVWRRTSAACVQKLTLPVCQGKPEYGFVWKLTLLVYSSQHCLC